MVSLALVAAACGGSDDSAYPAGELRILVGHAPGGGADNISRTIQPFLQEALGVPVVVENVGGAGGMVASRQVYEAAPDGSVIQAMNFPSYLLNETFGGDAPPFREFTYVYRVTARDSNGVAVALDSGIETWEDFVRVARTREMFYSVASGGNNLNNSTPGEAMILEHEGITLTHIPYDSGGEAVQAVIGGVSDVTIAALATLRRLSSEVRTIAYFAEEPMEDFADAVRFADLYPGAGYSTGLGFIAPPGMSQDILDRLVAAFDKIFQDPEFLEALSKTGVPGPMPAAEFKAYIDGVYASLDAVEDSIRSVAYLD